MQWSQLVNKCLHPPDPGHATTLDEFEALLNSKIEQQIARINTEGYHY